MQINLNQIPNNKTTVFQEDINFSNREISSLFIREIISCQAKVEISLFEDIYRFKINAKSKIVAISAYSLKDVPLTIISKDEIDTREDEISEYFNIKNNIVYLDDYIFSLLVCDIPIDVHLKDEKPPTLDDES